MSAEGEGGDISDEYSDDDDPGNPQSGQCDAYNVFDLP